MLLARSGGRSKRTVDRRMLSLVAVLAFHSFGEVTATSMKDFQDKVYEAEKTSEEVLEGLGAPRAQATLSNQPSGAVWTGQRFRNYIYSIYSITDTQNSCNVSLEARCVSRSNSSGSKIQLSNKNAIASPHAYGRPRSLKVWEHDLKESCAGEDKTSCTSSSSRLSSESKSRSHRRTASISNFLRRPHTTFSYAKSIQGSSCTGH